jgi:hypothetical protein
MEILDVGALATAVRARAPDAPLDRVEAAIAVGEELASGGDELIGRFVAEARDAGCRGKAAAGACSFCGKPGGAGLRLVAGPGVHICAECVGLCKEILAGDSADATDEGDPRA